LARVGTSAIRRAHGFGRTLAGGSANQAVARRDRQLTERRRIKMKLIILLVILSFDFAALGTLHIADKVNEECSFGVFIALFSACIIGIIIGLWLT
jgi:hypothetical protein